jgi:YidC/Oxa1 family membrane protein insertase
MQTNNDNNRHLIFAVALSILVLVGWSYFFDKPRLQQPETPKQIATVTTPTITQTPLQEVKAVVTQGGRIAIKTPSVEGTFRLAGCRFDDLTLKNYRETTDDQSSFVRLLAPENTPHAYFLESSWTSPEASLTLPSAQTPWAVVQGQELTPETPVVLGWDSPQGLHFERHISIDKDYLISIKETVKNTRTQAVQLAQSSTLQRPVLPKTENFFILHEGPVAYLNDKLVELKYSDLDKKPLQSFTSVGGWVGLTDKYWLAALIPGQQDQTTVVFQNLKPGQQSHYVLTTQSGVTTLAPEQTLEKTYHFFAGAKVLTLLDHYETVLGIKHFDLAVDFGWFYFITKPLFHLLTKAKDWLGNVGLGILLLTIVLKILFFPLANKSYRSMARMRALQPKMNALRERFASDKMRMNQEIMQLYQREKVNPMAGCLPMIIQIPVFFALYKVLFITIEMRHAPFFGWVHDLSAPDPTTLFNLFGVLAWNPPSWLMIGAWPLIMGVTMVVQQKLNPPAADPVQEKMMMVLPIMFTVMLAQFPVGLVIYWAWNNLLTIGQQWTIMRLEGDKPEPKVRR